MRRLDKLALIVMLMAITAFGLASGIKWQTNLKEALKIAKKTGKPVMIDFYGDY